jgi:hypothetical protein
VKDRLPSGSTVGAVMVFSDSTPNSDMGPDFAYIVPRTAAGMVTCAQLSDYPRHHLLRLVRCTVFKLQDGDRRGFGAHCTQRRARLRSGCGPDFKQG